LSPCSSLAENNLQTLSTHRSVTCTVYTRI